MSGVPTAAQIAVARHIASNDGEGHWESVVNKAPYLNAPRALLEVAVPDLRKAWEEELLGDEAVDAMAQRLARHAERFAGEQFASGYVRTSWGLSDVRRRFRDFALRDLRAAIETTRGEGV